MNGNGIKISPTNLRAVVYIALSLLAMAVAFGALKANINENTTDIKEIKPIMKKVTILEIQYKHIRECLARIEAKIDKNGRRKR